MFIKFNSIVWKAVFAFIACYFLYDMEYNPYAGSAYKQSLYECANNYEQFGESIYSCFMTKSQWQRYVKLTLHDKCSKKNGIREEFYCWAYE